MWAFRNTKLERLIESISTQDGLKVPRSSPLAGAGRQAPVGVGNNQRGGWRMRSRWTILAAVAATCWVAPQLAVAEDQVEAQLRQMNERMAQMEQQLQATNEELAASKQQVQEQQGLIQDMDKDREASSALSKFLSETEFSGLVAASYTFNFKRLDSSAVGRNANSTTSGENAGVFGLTAPFHTNSNNFQVDQLAFRMKKTATPESRAAWGASLTWGSSADWLAGRISSCEDTEGAPFCETDSDATGDLPELTEAYVGYLWDVGGGIKSTLGRYMTPVGAESFFANENFNVTRGMLWTLQPVNHTGGNLSGGFGEDFTWQIGGSNSYGNTMSNPDSHPTFVGSVGYKADTLGFKVNGVYGGDIDDLLAPLGQFGVITPSPGGFGLGQFNSGFERNSDNIGLLDAVLTFDPSDKLSTWVNFDYWWTGKTGYGSATNPGGTFTLDKLAIWGIAGAGRYAVTENTGFSLRYEYLSINNLGVAAQTASGPIVGFVNSRGADFQLMSLTGTIDHHLTDNLVLSAEARWDRARGSGDDDFFLDKLSGDSTSDDLNDADFLDKGSNHQVLGIVQLRYDF